MIVVFHTTVFFGNDARYWHREWLTLNSAGLGVSIDYFFVLSGAVILMAHRADIGRIATLRPYLWKRFRRVYPIYWIVFTCLTIGIELHPKLGETVRSNPWVVISGYLLVFVNTLQLNLLTSWTLFQEVLFYSLFAVLLASRRVGTTVFAAWFVLSIVSLVHPGPVVWSFYLGNPLHLLFGFGMLAAWLLRSRPNLPARRFIAVGGVILFCAFIAGDIYGYVPVPLGLVAGVGSTFLLIGIASREDQGILTIPRPLRFMGDASYSIYLIHYPCFMVCSPLLYHLWVRHPIPIAIPFIVMLVSGVAAGCLLHVYVERPLLRWLPR